MTRSWVDVLDPARLVAPRRKDVSHPGYVDHLLSPAHPPGGRCPPAPARKTPVEAAVGDGARRKVPQALGAWSPSKGASDPDPQDDARPQLGELLRRIAAGQQVEGGLVGRPWQRAERRRPAYQRVHVVDVELLDRHHRHHLLGEDVERVLRTCTDSMPPTSICSTVTAAWTRSARCLGNKTPREISPDLVASAADSLQAAGDRRRCLHLNDQIDRTHVDAQLEAAGGHDAGQPPGLEVVLDDGALLLADRPVMGTGELRQPLRRTGRPGP
jgi:hypothetical protein